ncbi:MAG: hypothetical protein Q9166_007768 [cf. Caloplaca sp. 2 TL-2023]
MALLETHLEQISLSAAAIAELPFPPPKKFTNVLLRPHDITALIRDTEAHERVLFKPATPESASSQVYESVPRRGTVYGLKGGSENPSNGLDFSRPPRQRSAITTLLGTDFEDQLRNGGAQAGKERAEVDDSALTLPSPIPGARERISSLRSRFDQSSASVSRYEARASKQAAQLAKRNHREDEVEGRDDTGLGKPADPGPNGERPNEMPITAEDFEREEQEIRDLERKKRALEDRVSGMERDLGCLLR